MSPWDIRVFYFQGKGESPWNSYYSQRSCTVFDQERTQWTDDGDVENGHLFEEWLQEDHLILVQPERGDLLKGTIVQIGPNEVLVDINAKRDAYVPPDDLARLPPEVREQLYEGQEVNVIVTRVYEDTGDIEVSLSKALQARDWIRAAELMEQKAIIETEVIAYNRGGLIVRFGQIRGFVPLSQMADIPRNISAEERSQRMAALVGKKIPVCVIEVDRSRRRLILSEREAQHQLREQRRDELLATLKEGDIIKGRVRSFASFGVFVDLDGVDGLIHRSEISWDRTVNPQEVLQIGQEVETVVVKVDRKARRIGLSLKRMQPNPWLERVEKYKEGDIVDAVVINVTDFGVFARIEEGLEGLIHVSELPLASGQRPQDAFEIGDEIRVRIIGIDTQRQRISLSMRQVPQWDVAEETTEENESLTPSSPENAVNGGIGGEEQGEEAQQ